MGLTWRAQSENSGGAASACWLQAYLLRAMQVPVRERAEGARGARLQCSKASRTHLLHVLALVEVGAQHALHEVVLFHPLNKCLQQRGQRARRF